MMEKGKIGEIMNLLDVRNSLFLGEVVFFFV